jgi:hypothetical protein
MDDMRAEERRSSVQDEVTPKPRKKKRWWGAKGLSEELDTTERRAKHLLAKRVVPGAVLVCGRWTGPVDRLAELGHDV